MKEAIKDLAKSKVCSYIGVMFYLGSFGLAAGGLEWEALFCLILVIIAAMVKVFYELRFVQKIYKSNGGKQNGN